jgi:hypothetical protein
MTRRFSQPLLRALDRGYALRIRAGTGDHRFLGIWVVVVAGRVFVRSWNLKAHGWYWTLAEERVGAIQVKEKVVAIRARPARGVRLLAAIDRAYLTKYQGPGSRKFARGLASMKRRASTTELLPTVSR